MHLRSIRSFKQLVRYLEDELDWPLQGHDIEDLTFDYEPDEPGLKPADAAKVKAIRQLRPLDSKQPWPLPSHSTTPSAPPSAEVLLTKSAASWHDSEHLSHPSSYNWFQSHQSFEFAYANWKIVARSAGFSRRVLR